MSKKKAETAADSQPERSGQKAKADKASHVPPKNTEQTEQLPASDNSDAAVSEAINSPAASESASAQAPDWERELARLEAEKQELKEALLRKQADFENYRRRMQKDKEEAIQYANRSLISELLEVLDNFERALASHQDEKDSNPGMKGLLEGLELVEKQLCEMLFSRWGLKAIESVGQEFDPNFHEALMMEENHDYPVATVTEVFQTGYTLYDRVLRPARVKIAKPTS